MTVIFYLNYGMLDSAISKSMVDFMDIIVRSIYINFI